MFRNRILVVAVVSLCGIAIAFAKPKEPESGPELAKLLYEKYHIGCPVDREGNIYAISFDALEVADTDGAIDRIVKIPTVRLVHMTRVNLDSESLAKLHNLPHLSALRLPYCKFKDKSLESLKDLSLTELDLTGTHITDEGLAFLASLKNLGRLRLSKTKITGSGFKYLESLPIQDLNLTATPITDDSLKSLAKIHTLQVLNLSHTPVSDDGLSHISGLYLLFSLNVDEAQTTHGGRSWFREEYDEFRSEAEKKGLVPRNHPALVIGYQ
jgi:hypothetical protein